MTCECSAKRLDAPLRQRNWSGAPKAVCKRLLPADKERPAALRNRARLTACVRAGQNLSVKGQNPVLTELEDKVQKAHERTVEALPRTSAHVHIGSLIAPGRGPT